MTGQFELHRRTTMKKSSQFLSRFNQSLLSISIELFQTFKSFLKRFRSNSKMLLPYVMVFLLRFTLKLFCAEKYMPKSLIIYRVTRKRGLMI